MMPEKNKKNATQNNCTYLFYFYLCYFSRNANICFCHAKSFNGKMLNKNSQDSYFIYNNFHAKIGKKKCFYCTLLENISYFEIEYNLFILINNQRKIDFSFVSFVPNV